MDTAGTDEPSARTPGTGPGAGVLVLAATPIGRVADAPPRLADELARADVVAAEDTRRLRRLVAELGVTVGGRVVSYFDGNESSRTPVLIDALAGGERVLVVTDAGMPSVSDPGYRLVAAAVERGITVTTVPGPSAVLAALAVSGLPVDRFCFEGFLPRKAGERGRRLAELREERRTMVFFEAPHRTGATLAAMAEAFGADRRAAVCRELTKTHEEVRRAGLSDLARWAADGVRGEVTLVVEGGDAPGQGDAPVEPEALAALVAEELATGSTRKEALVEVARRAGVHRRVVYDAVVASKHRSKDGEGRVADRSRPPAPEPLPHPVVDNHCHLDLAGRREQPDAPGDPGLSVEDAVARAAAVGVTRIVQIGCDLPGARWAVEAATRHAALVAGVALHPNEAPLLDAAGRLDAALGEIEELAGSSDRVRAVGETGLDYFRTGGDGRAAQQRSFRWHIDLAKRLDRTLVIHDRDAHDDVLRLLDEEGVPDRVVMHCFSGDVDVARRCLDRGAWLSFAGTVTFKNADPLRAALRVVPSDRLLVETDAPYLTPMPHRGRPNASYLVPLTMRSMAETRGEDLEALCAAVDANTDEAFGGTW